MNHQIRIPEIRVIASDGRQLGVMITREALKMAQEEGLDLVEISPTARPPVCKIMDYGKYKYDQEKKRREAKKKQVVIQLKEVQLRPSTDKHDLETKMKHIKRFLEDGNKAKITIRFRGREMAHRDLGMEMLKKVIADLGPAVKVDQEPTFEGKMLSVILAPSTTGGKGTTESKKEAVKESKEKETKEVQYAKVENQ